MLFMMNKNTMIAAVAVVAILGQPNGADAATCGTKVDGSMPQDGQDCLGYMPAGSSTIGCSGESYSGTTKTAATCECDPSKATTWTCVATDSQIIHNACPSQEDPKTTGESCEGLLSEPSSQQKCMWSRRTSMDLPVESFWCTCANTGESVNKWVCNGSFAPASAATADNGMMPANTQQEVVTTPVVPPAGSTGTVTVSKAVCPATQVENASSCAGFLPGALSEATCTYLQTTQENNDTPVTTNTACTCRATDPSWSCAAPVDVSKANEETNVANMDVGGAEDNAEANTAVTENNAEATADATEATAENADVSNLATDEITATTNEADTEIADNTKEADATIATAEGNSEGHSDVATDEVTADTEIADKTKEADATIATAEGNSEGHSEVATDEVTADTEIADKTKEADATIATASNESTSGATTATARMNFTTMAFIVAVLATTTTIL